MRPPTTPTPPASQTPEPPNTLGLAAPPTLFTPPNPPQARCRRCRRWHTPNSTHPGYGPHCWRQLAPTPAVTWRRRDFQQPGPSLLDKEIHDMRLRVGRSTARTLYQINEDGTEHLIGLIDDPETAAQLVKAVNSYAAARIGSPTLQRQKVEDVGI